MKIFFISRIDNVVQSLRFLVGEFFAEGKFAEENFVKSLACWGMCQRVIFLLEMENQMEQFCRLEGFESVNVCNYR